MTSSIMVPTLLSLQIFAPLSTTLPSESWRMICPLTLTHRHREKGAPPGGIRRAAAGRQLCILYFLASSRPWLQPQSGLSCRCRRVGTVVTSCSKAAVRLDAPKTDGRKTLEESEVSFEKEDEFDGIGPEATVPVFDDLKKECLQCHRVKLLVDFERRTDGEDGRTELCRACMATFRGKRSQREPPHLRLSVVEAWERGKVCNRCGIFKECRDFAQHSGREDGLQRRCRACENEIYLRRPSKQPIDTPKECALCNKVKPAAEFFREKKDPSGLQRSCRECKSQLYARRHEELKGTPKLVREKKRCNTCDMVKKRSDFHCTRSTIDGLFHWCKECTNKKQRIAHEKKRKEKRDSLPLDRGPV